MGDVALAHIGWASGTSDASARVGREGRKRGGARRARLARCRSGTPRSRHRACAEDPLTRKKREPDQESKAQPNAAVET